MTICIHWQRGEALPRLDNAEFGQEEPNEGQDEQEARHVDDHVHRVLRLEQPGEALVDRLEILVRLVHLVLRVLQHAVLCVELLADLDGALGDAPEAGVDTVEGSVLALLFFGQALHLLRRLWVVFEPLRRGPVAVVRTATLRRSAVLRLQALRQCLPKVGLLQRFSLVRGGLVVDLLGLLGAQVPLLVQLFERLDDLLRGRHRLLALLRDAFADLQLVGSRVRCLPRLRNLLVRPHHVAHCGFGECLHGLHVGFQRAHFCVDVTRHDGDFGRRLVTFLRLLVALHDLLAQLLRRVHEGGDLVLERVARSLLPVVVFVVGTARLPDLAQAIHDVAQGRTADDLVDVTNHDVKMKMEEFRLQDQ
mmetsp:Transcript_41312/g.127644  ORF Transcript_41312/g.127644 Transcript_41312/m.127644 type:complete len:363 (-) Transcript_41312:35-1123(-)